MNWCNPSFFSAIGRYRSGSKFLLFRLIFIALTSTTSFAMDENYCSIILSTGDISKITTGEPAKIFYKGEVITTTSAGIVGVIKNMDGTEEVVSVYDSTLEHRHDIPANHAKVLTADGRTEVSINLLPSIIRSGCQGDYPHCAAYSVLNAVQQMALQGWSNALVDLLKADRKAFLEKAIQDFSEGKDMEFIKNPHEPEARQKQFEAIKEFFEENGVSGRHLISLSNKGDDELFSHLEKGGLAILGYPSYLRLVSVDSTLHDFSATPFKVRDYWHSRMTNYRSRSLPGLSNRGLTAHAVLAVGLSKKGMEVVIVDSGYSPAHPNDSLWLMSRFGLRDYDASRLQARYDYILIE